MRFHRHLHTIISDSKRQEIAMADIRDAMEELALILSRRSCLDTMEILPAVPPLSGNRATMNVIIPASFDAQIIPCPAKTGEKD